MGPSHQRVWPNSYPGNMPLAAQSAGFSKVGTCFQASGGMAFSTVAILFPTNVRYLLGFPSSHASMIVLSHHANTLLMGISRAVLTLVSSLESSVAPQSSSLGMVRGLRGATFVLEATKDTTGG